MTVVQQMMIKKKPPWPPHAVGMTAKENSMQGCISILVGLRFWDLVDWWTAVLMVVVLSEKLPEISWEFFFSSGGRWL